MNLSCHGSVSVACSSVGQFSSVYMQWADCSAPRRYLGKAKSQGPERPFGESFSTQGTKAKLCREEFGLSLDTPQMREVFTHC